MTRLSRCLLLTAVLLALPFQGAAAAVMAVCSTSAAAAVASMSMSERHAAIKAKVESALQESSHDHCADMAQQADPDAAQDTGAHAPDTSHHGQDGACSACGVCSLGTALPPSLPPLSLDGANDVRAPARAERFASFLPLPAGRPPASRG